MKKQTAGREHLGKLAPKFAELNDDVLFGEVWSREDKFSLRDRSMITIAALFSAGQYPQLKAHLAIGREHGKDPYRRYRPGYLFCTDIVNHNQWCNTYIGC